VDFGETARSDVNRNNYLKSGESFWGFLKIAAKNEQCKKFFGSNFLSKLNNFNVTKSSFNR
jgi:hypothetical protein